MRERGDLHCFHEPFIHYYYVHLGVKKLAHFDADTNQPTEFDEIVNHLKQHAISKHVFFKDMSYYVVPKIFEYDDLAESLNHVFLIRDPRKSILSYYKLDNDIICDEIGLEAQWQHLEWIHNTTGDTPLVIEAESIQNDPKKIMSQAWEKLDLPFLEHAFEWQNDEMPKDWQYVAGWHKAASSSNTIEPASLENESEIQTRFDQMAKNAPQLKQYLSHHWPYYQRLKNLAL